MPRAHLISGRWSLRDGRPRTKLEALFADRRDAKHVRRLVAQFDKLARADWDDIDALVEVFASADRLDASASVRAALLSHPPVTTAIEANASSPAVRAFVSRS